MASSGKDGDTHGAPSEPLLKEEDAEKHQHRSEEAQRREGSDVPVQATVRHDAKAAPADRGDTGEQAGEKQGHVHRSHVRDWTTLVALSQLAVAICTLGTLAVTGLQLNAMQAQLVEAEKSNKKLAEAIVVSKDQIQKSEDANKIAKAALVSSERPWLFPKVSLASKAGGSDWDRTILISVRNDGKTPALEVKQNYYAYAFEAYGPTPKIEKGDDKKIGFLYPGTIVDAKYIIDESIARSMIYDHKSRTTIYLIGETIYKDLNGGEHKTLLCFTIRPNADALVQCQEPGRNTAD